MNYRKVHFFYFFHYFFRYSFFLALPIIQSVFLSSNDLSYLIINFSTNIILIITIVLFCFIKYKKTFFYCLSENLYIISNLFIKYETVLNRNYFSVISIQEIFLYRIIGRAYKFICTNQTSGKIPSATLFLNQDSAYFLKKFFKKDNSILKYESEDKNTFFYILLNSNFVTGLIIVLPIINKTEKIINNSFINEVYSQLNIINYLVKFGISPILAFISNTIILGWIFSFFIQFEKYYHHKIFCNNDQLIISHGLINKYLNILNKNRISCYELRQNLAYIILNKYSCFYSILGQKYLKNDKGILCLFETKGKIKNILFNNTKFSYKDLYSISINKKYIFNYTLIDFIFLCSLLIFTIFINNEVLKYLMLIFIIYFSYSIVLIKMSFDKIKISINDSGDINILTVTNLFLKEYYFSSNNISKILITQNIFKRRKGIANIIIYLKADKTKKIKVKYLDLEKINKFISIIRN